MPPAPLRPGGAGPPVALRAASAGSSKGAYAPTSVVAAMSDCADADVDFALQQALRALREHVGGKQVPAQVVAQVAQWLSHADLSHAQASRTLARLTSLWMGRISPAVARTLPDLLLPPLWIPGEHVDACLGVLTHVACVRRPTNERRARPPWCRSFRASCRSAARRTYWPCWRRTRRSCRCGRPSLRRAKGSGRWRGPGTCTL